MRIKIWIAGGAAALAVAVGVGVAGPAMAATTAGNAVSAAACAHPLAALRAAPDAVKNDLKAARALPADQRPAALAAIRDKALAGTYGDVVQQRAEGRAVRWLARWKDAPDDLKAAVKTVVDTPAGDARRAAAKDLWQRVLAGDFGNTVQQKAQSVKTHVIACHA